MSDLRVETKVRRKNNLKYNWKQFVRLMQMVHSCQTYVGLSDVISGDHDEEEVLKLRDYEAEKLGSAAW